MVEAINRAHRMSLGFRRIAELVSRTQIPSKECIFLSHHRDDTEAARAIASYVLSAGIDVWFDESDHALQFAVRDGDPDRVTQAIEAGLNESDYMVCMVSGSTVNSYWVPFEVGYVYRKVKKLVIMPLKGLLSSSLPDYMRATHVSQGRRGLNELLAQIAGSSSLILEGQGRVTRASASDHPLRSVLDE